MAITKTQSIKRITVFGDYKFMQVIGEEVIEEDGEQLAVKEIAFGLQPDTDLTSHPQYQALPELEKAKVDELVTTLYTDERKASYQAHLAALETA